MIFFVSYKQKSPEFLIQGFFVLLLGSN